MERNLNYLKGQRKKKTFIQLLLYNLTFHKCSELLSKQNAYRKKKKRIKTMKKNNEKKIISNVPVDQRSSTY